MIMCIAFYIYKRWEKFLKTFERVEKVVKSSSRLHLWLYLKAHNFLKPSHENVWEWLPPPL